jgi:hypothetical protein
MAIPFGKLLKRGAGAVPPPDLGAVPPPDMGAPPMGAASVQPSMGALMGKPKSRAKRRGKGKG